MNNLITDVPGLRVGAAHDARLASGVSVVVFDEPAAAGIADSWRRAGAARRRRCSRRR